MGKALLKWQYFVCLVSFAVMGLEPRTQNLRKCYTTELNPSPKLAVFEKYIDAGSMAKALALKCSELSTIPGAHRWKERALVVL